MALHALNVLPSKLDPALKMHWREHFGGTVTLHRHKVLTESPRYMRPVYAAPDGTGQRVP